MVSLESLLCNSCGAPLQVPASAKYVKCNHCQTQLQVHRDAGVTFTESIEELNETTRSLTDQVAKLTAQQKLSDLDRQWELEREQYMVSGQNGVKRLPSEGGSAIGGIVIVGFGIFWTIGAAGMASSSPFRGPGFLPLFGIIFIGFGIFASIHGYQKAGDYREAHKKYKREREKLQRDFKG